MDTSEVKLRTLRADDLDYLYRWENDPEVWQYGDCGADDSHGESSSVETTTTRNSRVPSGMRSTIRFTREELREFIENQQHGFEANEQLRFVICRREGASTAPGAPIGFVDLFDYDPVERTAAIGILICDPADRRRGYGRRALTLALDRARYVLCLRKITCTISPDNPASAALFAGAGFRTQCGNISTRYLTQ